ncbi:MAG: ABC transporter permease subunit [Clostridia bacterium]|nr:ABC transporter permease subunit [Clostridia bacterium]
MTKRALLKKSSSLPVKGEPAPARKKRKRFTWDDFELSLLSLPSAAWFIAFCYIPLFGIVFAFKNYKYKPGKGFIYSLFVHSKWVGLKNFEFLFRSPDLKNIFRNTLGYNIIFIIIGVTLPVALAIMITQLRSRKLAKVCQTAVFLPHFLSWVVISYFVYAFLSTDKGLLNSIIQSFGGEPVRWYQESKYWPYILVFINTWKTFGYSMVVYMATITGIDQTLYESAVIDGATKWQQTKGITLPLLRPVISIMFILNVGHIFSSDFGLFYQVTRDSNSIIGVTQTLDVYVYKALMESNNYNYSAAVSLLQNTLGCILLLIANFTVKKIDPESGLF